MGNRGIKATELDNNCDTCSIDVEVSSTRSFELLRKEKSRWWRRERRDPCGSVNSLVFLPELRADPIKPDKTSPITEMRRRFATSMGVGEDEQHKQMDHSDNTVSATSVTNGSLTSTTPPISSLSSSPRGLPMTQQSPDSEAFAAFVDNLIEIVENPEQMDFSDMLLHNDEEALLRGLMKDGKIQRKRSLEESALYDDTGSRSGSNNLSPVFTLPCIEQPVTHRGDQHSFENIIDELEREIAQIESSFNQVKRSPTYTLDSKQSFTETIVELENDSGNDEKARQHEHTPPPISVRQPRCARIRPQILPSEIVSHEQESSRPPSFRTPCQSAQIRPANKDLVESNKTIKGSQWQFWVSCRQLAVFENSMDRRVKSIARVSGCVINLTDEKKRNIYGDWQQKVIILARSDSGLLKCKNLFEEKFPSFHVATGSGPMTRRT